MANVLIKSAIEAVRDRVQSTSASATAEELAYLGTALERIGGKATVLEVVEVADAKLGEMTVAMNALSDQQDARLLARGNAQDARLVSQGDTQEARVTAEGDLQVSVLQSFSPNGVQRITLNPGQVLDFTLAAGRHVVVGCSQIGAAVCLPDATTLEIGRSRLTLALAPESFPVGVLDASGRVIGQLEPGDLVECHLLDNSSAAGEWDYTGNLLPCWIAASTDFQLLHNSQSTMGFATRYLYYGRDTSNYPFIQSVSVSGDSIVVSPMVVLSATGGEDIAQIIEVDANRYLVRFGNTKLRVIDFTDPATPVVGATVTLGSNPWRLDRFGTREAWAALRIDSATSKIYAVPINLSGTTLSLGSEVQGTIFCTNWHSITYAFALSDSTLGILIQCNNSSDNWYRLSGIRLMRNADGSLTFGTAVQNPANTNTGSTSNQYQAFHLGGNAALVFYMDSSQRIRTSVCTFDATSSYSTDVLMNQTTGTWGYTVTPLGERRFYLSNNNQSALAGQVVDVTAVGNAIVQGAVLTLSAGNTLHTNVAQLGEGRVLLYGSNEYFALVALAADGAQTVLQSSFTGGTRNPMLGGNGWGNWGVYALPNYRHAFYFISNSGTAPYSQTLYRVAVSNEQLKAVPIANSDNGSINVMAWQASRPLMLTGHPARRYGIAVGTRMRFGVDRSLIFYEFLTRLSDRQALGRSYLGYGSSANELRLRHFLLKFAEA